MRLNNSLITQVVLLMLYSERMISSSDEFKNIITEIHIKEIAELATKEFLLVFMTKGFFLKNQFLIIKEFFWLRDFVEFFQNFSNFFSNFKFFLLSQMLKNWPTKPPKKKTLFMTRILHGVWVFKY